MSAVLAAVMLTLAAVGANAWLLDRDATREILTPDPSRVVQNFVGAVAARRPSIARQYVAAHAAGDVPTEPLKAFASRLGVERERFRFVDATDTRHGDSASVRTRLRTSHGEDVELTFHLARDPSTQLWKIVAM